jgi:uncharacterized protein YjbI with pentapeptide repeats
VLDFVDLSQAYLRYANMESASFRGVDFTDAVLKDVNLRRADMRYSNLENAASLASANLAGLSMDFISPQTKDAVVIEKLRRMKNLEGVTLPDGTILSGEDSFDDNSGESWRQELEQWCSS